MKKQFKKWCIDYYVFSYTKLPRKKKKALMKNLHRFFYELHKHDLLSKIQCVYPTVGDGTKSVEPVKINLINPKRPLLQDKRGRNRGYTT